MSVQYSDPTGYLRIVGELRKLGVTVSATSVRNVLRHHGLRPAPRREGPTWSEFLRSQAQSMLATDFFHVDAVNGQRYYALFVIEIERRVVHLLGVTTNPNGRWVTQLARNLVWDLQEAKRSITFLVRDRDAKFTATFDEVLRSEGIETIRTPVRAPRANAFAERWVETVRAECLDHLLIFFHGQLQHVLHTYVEHYNAARPHRGIGLGTPRPIVPGNPVGHVTRQGCSRRSHPRVPTRRLSSKLAGATPPQVRDLRFERQRSHSRTRHVPSFPHLGPGPLRVELPMH